MLHIRNSQVATNVLNKVVHVGPHAKVTNLITGEWDFAWSMMLLQQIEEGCPLSERMGYYDDPLIIIPDALAVDGGNDLVFGPTNLEVNGFVWESGLGDLFMVPWHQCYFDETISQ